MIGYLHLYIITEFQFYISLFEQAENETGSQFYAVAYICIINSKQMRIFIPHCKIQVDEAPTTGRLSSKSTYGQSGDLLQLACAPDLSNCWKSKPLRSISLFKQMHSIAYCVEHTHHIFTQPGEIIIDVTTVEETYMLPVVILRSHRILLNQLSNVWEEYFGNTR